MAGLLLAVAVGGFAVGRWTSDSSETATQTMPQGCSAHTETFGFPSASMEPTIPLKGGAVVVDLGAFQRQIPKRGDIVLFTARTEPPVQSIKRIVGMPGETIEAKGGAVYVDSNRLPEPYLAPGTTTTGLPRQEVRGGYFLMGDNRGNSEDSRIYGAVDFGQVLGRVVLGGCL